MQSVRICTAVVFYSLLGDTHEVTFAFFHYANYRNPNLVAWEMNHLCKMLVVHMEHTLVMFGSGYCCGPCMHNILYMTTIA